MEGRCTQKKITLAYPKHRFTPEDLLHFIESREFTDQWTALGLDAEDDLESLQMCIMARPHGDGEVAGTDGLRYHTHNFDWACDKGEITAYYAHFEEYGIVYLNCVDSEKGLVEFDTSERAAIRESLAAVKRELDRRPVLR